VRNLMLIPVLAMAGCLQQTPAEPPPPEPPPSPITWETCSQSIGDHPCDFTLQDQNDDDFNLYEHYGDFIMIDLSVMWCGPCQRAADEVQMTEDYFNDQLGDDQQFHYVTILIEDLDGDPPDLEDVDSWATYFEITSAPVLQGSRDLLGNSDEGWPLQGWPTFFFIDDEMQLVNSQRGFSAPHISELIHELLGLEGA